MIICRPWVQLSDYEYGRHDYIGYNYGFSDPWTIVFVPRPPNHPYHNTLLDNGFRWSVRYKSSWSDNTQFGKIVGWQSLEEAKAAADTVATKLGYTLLSEEDVEKWELLA